MAIIYANDETFKESIKDSIVLVDFYADWCGPCKRLAPILENINNIQIVKVNVDEAPNTSEELGIMSIPTLIVFKDGEVVTRKVGLPSKEEILEMTNI